MNSARKNALDAIKVGDVVYGVSGGGNEKLLLVYEVNDDGFSARHITSKSWAEFDRNGHSKPIASGGSCTIVSIAALPAEEYKVALGLDLKMRTGKEYPDFVLSRAEIQLILTYGDFFRAHPLPE